MEKKHYYFSPVVSFRLSKNLLNKIDSLAKTERKTRTAIIIALLARALDL
ncbi:MAG: ribbon-helix-helix protein, CopG family [Cetobacterium sp.]